MRAIVVAIFILVLCTAVSEETGGSQSATVAGLASENSLSVVGETKSFRFRLGSRMIIRARGTYAKAISDELNKPTTEGITLRLNGVAMTMLKPEEKVAVEKVNSKEQGGIDLSYFLERDSGNTESREAWNTVLSRRKGKATTVTLSIGAKPAFNVSPDKGVELFVAAPRWIWTARILSLVLFLMSYSWLIRSPTALRISKNGPYSLGRSQMAFWGLVIVLAFSSVSFLTGTIERLPDQVLLLAGISGATGFSAALLGAGKSQAFKLSVLGGRVLELERELLRASNQFPASSRTELNRLRKELKALEDFECPVALGWKKFWTDICDDGKGLSFHRFQAVLWTLVLGIAFVVTVSEHLSMPEFSDTLLVLMGISNGTYIGFKSQEKP